MRQNRFLGELLRKKKELASLKKREVSVFNVRGNYGDYQVKLGPLDEKRHTRPIEINGEVHHLFLTHNKILPLPTHEDIKNNMRGTVIMSEVTVHLFDNEGKGRAVAIKKPKIDGAHPRNEINLAGKEGDDALHRMEANGKLAEETYRIVQEDILKSLKWSELQS